MYNNRVTSTTSLPIVTTSEAITKYFQTPESTSEFLSDTTVGTATSASPNLIPTGPILTTSEAITEYFQTPESTSEFLSDTPNLIPTRPNYFEIPESTSKTSSEATVETKTSDSPNLKTIKPLNESVNESMTVKDFVIIIIVLITLLCSGLVPYFVYSCKMRNRPNQSLKCSYKNTMDPMVSIDVNFRCQQDTKFKHNI